MKKTTTLALFLLAASTIGAQSNQGGISSDMLRQMQQGMTTRIADKAIFNAMASNSIDNLAKNFKRQGPVDTYFNVETPAQTIHDQKQSGRCWMFSGLNVLRSKFARQHKDSITVEFSQAYLFFYDQLEKSNLFLQGVIDHAKKPMDDQRVQFFFKSPIGDGGTFCGVADLAEKYGLVPREAQPETFSAENTSRASRLITSKLREYGLELRRMVADGKNSKVIKTRKTEMLTTIYHMLTLTLGEPVTEFSYAFKNKNGILSGNRWCPHQWYVHHGNERPSQGIL